MTAKAGGQEGMESGFNSLVWVHLTSLFELTTLKISTARGQSELGFVSASRFERPAQYVLASNTLRVVGFPLI